MNTQYWLNKIMDTVYRAPDATFYVGLSSVFEPLDNGLIRIQEPASDTGYFRVPLGETSEPVKGSIANINDIEFPESLESWWDGTDQARFWCLFDGPDETSNLLTIGSLDVSHYIERHTKLVIPSGLLSISIVDYDTYLSS